MGLHQPPRPPNFESFLYPHGRWYVRIFFFAKIKRKDELKEKWLSKCVKINIFNVLIYKSITILVSEIPVKELCSLKVSIYYLPSICCIC